MPFIQTMLDDNLFESPTVWVLIATNLNYVVLTVFGWFRGRYRKWSYMFRTGIEDDISYPHPLKLRPRGPLPHSQNDPGM